MRAHGHALLLAALVLSLAAGTLAMGYAHWTWVLSDAGRVQTGTSGGAWTRVSCSEYHTWPSPPSSFPDDIATAPVPGQ